MARTFNLFLFCVVPIQLQMMNCVCKWSRQRGSIYTSKVVKTNTKWQVKDKEKKYLKNNIFHIILLNNLDLIYSIYLSWLMKIKLKQLPKRCWYRGNGGFQLWQILQLCLSFSLFRWSHFFLIVTTSNFLF